MDVIYISEIFGWEAILIDMFLLSQATGGLRRSGDPQCRLKPVSKAYSGGTQATPAAMAARRRTSRQAMASAAVRSTKLCSLSLQ